MQSEDTLKEIHRLAVENNRILRGMRRHAFWGGIIRMLIYAALLLVPIWFYFTYLAPVVNEMMETVSEIQGTGAQARAQFTSFQEMLQQYQSLFSGSN